MTTDTDPTPICAHCGEPIAEGQQAIRMELPDAVLGLPTDDYIHNDDEAFRSDFLSAFINGEFRYYMRVLLDHGSICAWLEGTEADIHAFTKVWDKPKQYLGRRITGQLANAIPPWGDAVLGAECTAEVLVADHLPYITSSTNPTLRKALEAG